MTELHHLSSNRVDVIAFHVLSRMAKTTGNAVPVSPEIYNVLFKASGVGIISVIKDRKGTTHVIRLNKEQAMEYLQQSRGFVKPKDVANAVR